MEKTLLVIRELESKKIIKEFAIGGGIAVLYYIEPLLTYDLDVFFISSEEGLDILSPIYKYLKDKGYKAQKEHILIEGVPVQFIPVYNELVKEAVQNRIETRYGRIKTQIIGLEYLIAIMLQTDRAKDRERLLKIFEESEVDWKFLGTILSKHKLQGKLSKFRRRYLG